jgi:hypothetical protein
MGLNVLEKTIEIILLLFDDFMGLFDTHGMLVTAAENVPHVPSKQVLVKVNTTKIFCSFFLLHYI